MLHASELLLLGRVEGLLPRRVRVEVLPDLVDRLLELERVPRLARLLKVRLRVRARVRVRSSWTRCSVPACMDLQRTCLYMQCACMRARLQERRAVVRREHVHRREDQPVEWIVLDVALCGGYGGRLAAVRVQGVRRRR